MSGECEICSEHAVDCICHSEKKCQLPPEIEHKERLKIALSCLNMAFQIISECGYEVPDKFFLRKKDK